MQLLLFQCVKSKGAFQSSTPYDRPPSTTMEDKSGIRQKKFMSSVFCFAYEKEFAKIVQIVESKQKKYFIQQIPPHWKSWNSKTFLLLLRITNSQATFASTNRSFFCIQIDIHGSYFKGWSSHAFSIFFLNADTQSITFSDKPFHVLIKRK